MIPFYLLSRPLRRFFMGTVSLWNTWEPSLALASRESHNIHTIGDLGFNEMGSRQQFNAAALSLNDEGVQAVGTPRSLPCIAMST